MYLASFAITDFIPLLIFAVPIVAIAGGITAGIVRTLGQQRLMELAHRERIAAIERGIDPAKLPQIPVIGGDDSLSPYLSPHEYARRRSQGLMIGGLVTLAAGIGMGAFLSQMIDGNERVWVVSFIPIMVGLALLLSSWLVRPRNGEGAPPPRG